MKKRTIIGSLLMAVFVAALPAVGMAGWDISLSIPLPAFSSYSHEPAPPLPVLAIEPGPYFYGGYWYRSSGEQWFISAEAGGPWYVVGFGRVPGPVLSIPLVRGVRERHERLTFRPRGWLRRGGGHHGGRGHGRGHDD